MRRRLQPRPVSRLSPYLICRLHIWHLHPPGHFAWESTEIQSSCPLRQFCLSGRTLSLVKARTRGYIWPKQKGILQAYVNEESWGRRGISRLDLALDDITRTKFLYLWNSSSRLLPVSSFPNTPSLWLQDGCSSSSRPQSSHIQDSQGRTSLLPRRFNTILLALIGSPITVAQENGVQ